MKKIFFVYLIFAMLFSFPVIATASVVSIGTNDDGLYYFNNTLASISSFSVQGYLYIDNKNAAYSWVGRRKDKLLDDVRSVYHLRKDDAAFFFIKTNNELWAMGNNRIGHVGDDSGMNRSSPVFVMNDVANLFFENETVYALKTDKSRWAWGRVGNSVFYAPVKVDDYYNANQELLANHISMRNGNPANNPITSITIGSGNRTRYYEIRDGVLWGWGYNEGTLGDGTRATRNNPVKIFDAERVKRLLPDYFITESDDWYFYSTTYGHPLYFPEKAFTNVLYVYDTSRSSYVNGYWFSPDGKLLYSSPARSDFMGTREYSVTESISDIKLPSIRQHL